MMFWYSKDFTGHWPVGSALVVVADSEADAIEEAKRLCVDWGLVFDGTVHEVTESIMLFDGEY